KAKQRRQSATAYSAKPPIPEHMTRSPGRKADTSAPASTTSPDHSRPSRVPTPPCAPCERPSTSSKSARLSELARTRTRISVGPGLGRATSAPRGPHSVRIVALTAAGSGEAERAQPRLGRAVRPLADDLVRAGGEFEGCRHAVAE